MRYQQQIQHPKLNLTIKIQHTPLNLIPKPHININLHFLQPHHTTTLYHLPTPKIPLTLKTLTLIHFLTHNPPKLKIHYHLYQHQQN
ncbi:DUF1934 family protein, partial [Staphylococcus epidermidis]|uniref:DUF1934 family protein n=1 Tax=Staphylococcus epidermidis TaxID=1282 RepID=UPI0021B40790